MSSDRKRASDFIAAVAAKDPLLSEKILIIEDENELTDASGVATHPMSLLVFVQTSNEIQTLLITANKKGLSVVTRGTGTGLSGGATPISLSLIIDLSRMKKIHSIDTAAKHLVADAGVTLGAIEDALQPLGFFYPPDPASYRAASIGGTVATNAGGLRCVKYGVTADWVRTLEVVTPDGKIINVGHPVIKDSTGLDLKSLFIGSEGTLGVITKVGVSFEHLPAKQYLTLIAFDSVTAAALAVIEIRKRFTPSICEILDAGALLTRDTAALEPLLGPVKNWGADPTLLMLEVDGLAADIELQMLTEILAELFGETCRTHLVQQDELEQVFAVRRGSTPGKSALRETVEVLVEKKADTQMLAQDISVPLPKLLDTILLVRETAKTYGLESRIAAHAGDGNLHILLLSEEANAGDLLDTAMTAILQHSYDFGGATSGEHGIGSSKIKWARLDLGEDVINVHHQIKNALDPNTIMNPGKAF